MSKLAWHFQGIPGWAQQGWINSQYVKLIDPPIDNPFPNRLVIGRVYVPDNETNALIWKGASGAIEWVNRVSDIMLSRKYVHSWELPNEPQPVSDYNFCQRLAEFTRAAADLLHNRGLKVIGGNLAEGNPGGSTDTERSNLFCAIAEGLKYCDYWSQHAYWVPDSYQHPEAGYNQWHALRYQMNRNYAKQRGIVLPKIMLTEGGYDYGIVGKPKQGWRSQTSWDRYFADLKRFDKDLMNDPDVECCTLFVSGANWDWQDFEIGEEQSKQLASYISTTATPPVVIPVPPTPPQESVTMTIARPLPAGKGTVSQVFGANVADYAKYGFAGHEGLDYACPVGTEVLVSGSGMVKWAGVGTGTNAAYGKYVIINHGKFETWYCHLSTIMVKAGDVAMQGQIIGKSGNTGRSTGPHLHYAVKVPTAKNGSKGFVDPWALRVILGDA